ncbi:MAG: LysR family transcriptional regulator [Pseudomonas sp.]|nr:MAG: LysR family transcriptional regulator [Pseudomonas sp.]
MITQRRLLHLLTLVEHGHFGRAAEALNISQPALSKSIQALEAELGVPLVDRKSGGVSLTVFGQVVAERSTPLLTVEEDLRREIKLLNEHDIGSLKVAFGPYPSIICGYAGAARLLARHPRINIGMRVSGWHEVAQQVQTRTVDLGIAEISALQTNEQFTTELLGEHVGRLFCRPGHPLLSAGPITPVMLFKYPWICPRIPGRASAALPTNLGAAGTLDPQNGDFVPAIEIDVPMHLDSFLHTSDALAINLLSNMEPALLAGEVALVPVTGFTLKANYGFIYLRNRSLAPAAKAYMDEVRALEAEIRAKEQRLAEQFEKRRTDLSID